jgi:ethanolamine utilization protein EutP (predicted NTPase)
MGLFTSIVTGTDSADGARVDAVRRLLLKAGPAVSVTALWQSDLSGLRRNLWVRTTRMLRFPLR